VSYTGRHANLVGYNPDQTRSGKVPIVSAYIKVMSHKNIPVVLHVHEAPYIKDSNVTLISEYQVREHGIIIDSVSKRHKTVNGTFGTQRMILSEHVHVPFSDRGGLLGYEILPWKEGDEYVYDVFDITRGDTPWKPRKFQDDEDSPIVTNDTATTINTSDGATPPYATNVIATPETPSYVVPGIYKSMIPDSSATEPYYSVTEPYSFDPRLIHTFFETLYISVSQHEIGELQSTIERALPLAPLYTRECRGVTKHNRVCFTASLKA
jgi:hypothetical protein